MNQSNTIFRMSKFALSVLFFLLFKIGVAQTLVFHGEGAASKVNQLQATNLRTGESVSITGNKLVLTNTTGITSFTSSDKLKVFSSPGSGKITLEINSAQPGKATASIYAISGQLIASQAMQLTGELKRVEIPLQKTGIFICRVSGNQFAYAQKFAYTQSGSGTFAHSGIETDEALNSQAQLKSASLADNLPYKPGDSIRVECQSGQLSSAITILPSNDKAYSVQFGNCTDSNGNPAECKGQYTEYSPTVRQEIKGWGAFPSYHKNRSWSAEWGIIGKTNIQDALYKELGLNIMRVSIDKYYQTNSVKIDARMMEVKDHLLVAKKYGITQWFCSSWTPPSHLKLFNDESGVVFVNDKNQILSLGNPPKYNIYTDKITVNGVDYHRKVNTLKPENEELYSDYLVNCLKYLETNGAGLPIHISFQNEPLFAEAYYGGCVFEPEQYIRFTGLLRAKLDAAGYQAIKIGAGDFGSMQDALTAFGRKFSVFQTNPEFKNAVGDITVHSYDDNNRWDTNNARKISDCKEITAAMNTLPQDLWQTEYTSLFHGDWPATEQNEYGVTMHTMRHFMRDLLSMPVSYWVYWIAYTQGDGDNMILSGTNTALKKKKMFYIFF